MERNWKAILAAFVTFFIVTLAGVLFFFERVERSDSVSGPLVHPALGLAIYVACSVVLFDWAARRLGNAYQAAFVIGGAQWVLVNLDFVLRGERGLLTAGASTLLMLVTWLAVAFVHSHFVRRTA